MIIKDIKSEWLKVEHDLRYIICQAETLTSKDFFKIDKLKSSIIALCGFKLFKDDNSIFYKNMKLDVEDSIKYLNNRFPNNSLVFGNIEKFINENL